MLITALFVFARAAACFDYHDTQKPILSSPPALPLPSAESIELTSIPLPPVVESLQPGACSDAINRNGTGCIGKSTGLQAGNFLPDGNHILASLRFAGAPDGPDARSVYDGQQLVLLKADGTVFANGDSWKCITCGVPAEHATGAESPEYQSPQAFSDGRRILADSLVIDCGDALLAHDECTPEKIRIYPIRLDDREDGSGPGADLRELRLHPDNVHLGFNMFSFTDGQLGQTAFIGRLHFNASPAMGSNPRYDLSYVNQLYDPNASQPVSVHGDQLSLDNNAIAIGELRGFSGTGREVLYLGYPNESCNIDVFAADLFTGRVRRLTSHPGYCDPVQMSPDDESIVIMDTRSNDRITFMAGLRGVPPIVDMVTTTACSSVRNNGRRRFFQPYLLDRHGDHDDYYGQEINAASQGTPGSGAADDPEWNGRADPWFSPDGTRIVYWQAQTVPPECGDPNPLPCYNSTEPGGRTERVMVAHLTSRRPIPARKVEPIPDIIPWATPYQPGSPAPARIYPREGHYKLAGAHSGHASVSLTENASKTRLRTVEVTFHEGFSDDGRCSLTGSQRVTQDTEHITLNKLEWHSNLTRDCGGASSSGSGSQVTSHGGFWLSIDVLENGFWANGSLTTILEGVEYRQPGNGQ
ncbi:hypothetical protein Q7P37_008961 [Cladosporium fusiforme]